MHVAQPAISQTILDLENELGVKLLLRTKRSVQLTAAGTAFLRETEDKAALAKLPAEERAACEKLWADVAALLKKAEAPAKKEGKR